MATLWLHVTERCWEDVMREYVDTGRIRFIAYGEETCPDTGTLHYQVYMCFKNRVRVGTVRDLFPQCHVEIMEGSLQQNENYCSKEGTFTKLGDEPKQGIRNDLLAVRDLVVQGERPMKIARTTMDETVFTAVARHYRFFSELDRECSWSRRCAQGFLPPKTYLRVGNPDVGKSTRIHELHGYDDVWKWNPLLGKFFDGYINQSVAVFEDVQKGQIPPITFLKQLLDGYPMRVPIKCDPTGAVWQARTIYITSNEEPQYWYDYSNQSHYQAIMSRIFQGVRVFKDRPDEEFHRSSRFHHGDIPQTSIIQEEVQD